MTGLLRQGKLRLTAVWPPRARPTCIQVEERDLCSLPSRPTPPLVPSQQVLSGLCCSLYATLCMHLHASACTAGVQGQATCRFMYLCTDASTQLHMLGHTCVDTRVQACIPVNTEVYSYTLPCCRLQGPGLKSQGVFMRPSRGGRHYNMCEERRHDSIHLCAHSNNVYNIHLHPCVYTHTL